MTDALMILVTAPDKDEAARIAETLVTEKLAACVNIIAGIDSVYRWQGKIVRDQEVLMLIKTADDRYDRLEKRVKELHSYSTPEVIAIRLEDGSNDYLQWIKESTSGLGAKGKLS